jgi:hypothetical protein
MNCEGLAPEFDVPVSNEETEIVADKRIWIHDHYRAPRDARVAFRIWKVVQTSGTDIALVLGSCLIFLVHDQAPPPRLELGSSV